MYALNLVGSGTAVSPSSWTAPAIVRLNDPTAWDYAVSCDISTTGTPLSRHTWTALVYDILNDAMISFGGAVNSACTTNVQTTWKATFDSAGVPTWTNMSNPVPDSPPGYGNFAVYDPTTPGTSLVLNNSAGKLVRYNTVANTYTVLATGAFAVSSGTLVIDPVRKVLISIGHDYISHGGGFAIYSMDISHGSSFSWTDLTSLVSGCTSSAFDVTNPAIVYDSNISRIVGYSGTGQKVTIFDPGSRTCVDQTFSSPTVPPATGSQGIYQRFNFVPSINKYVMCNDPTHDCFTFTLSPDGANGLGHSTITCIDVDGDGYGTGPGCLGPDADDNDASIHTGAQAIAKYGTLAAFINHLGYNPTRLWIISTTGNDSTCAVGTLASPPSTPCASWLHVYQNGLTAGDMVMYRGGTYQDVAITPAGGTSGNPVVVMAYPGELPFEDNRPTSGGTSNGLLDASFHGWIVFDGIKVAGGLNTGCMNGGFSNNVIWRHIEAFECIQGLTAFQNLSDLTLEYSAVHDQNDASCGSCEHDVYFGSRNLPGSNVFIRRNLLYNPSAQRPALQVNGRIANAVLEQNIIYGTLDNAAAAIYNGMSYSSILSNLIFNNDGGIIFSNYDGDCYNANSGTQTNTGICPYSQTGNTIANNTIYVPYDVANPGHWANQALYVSNTSTGCYPVWNSALTYLTGDHALYSGTNYTSSIDGNTSTPPTNWTSAGSCTQTKQGNLGGNTYANNIFQNNANGYLPAVFFLATLNSSPCALDSGDTTLSTSIFLNNLFYQGAFSTTNVMQMCPSISGNLTIKTIAQLNAGLWSASSTNNLNADPTFVGASPSYWNSPASFNLRLLSGSPGRAAGTPGLAPLFDLLGTGLLALPNLGAYQTTTTTASSGSMMFGIGLLRGLGVIK